MNVVVPDLGGATDVTVVEVLVKPGDAIQKDTPIVTLESEKATMEIPSEAAGTVKEIKVKEGGKLSSGDTILILELSEPANIKESKKEESVEKENKEKPPETKKQSKQKTKPETNKKQERILEGTLESTNDVHAGPGVRRMARELGVNLTKVSGSGPKDRIVKEDLQWFVKNQLSRLQETNEFNLPAAPAIDFSKFGPTDIKALSRIQKISGKNLQRNWMMIPHVTQFGEADITTLEEFRKQHKKEAEKLKIKLTPLVFVMKAVVSSLKAFPYFNASLDPSGEHLIMKHYYHVGVAVDTPDGLVVPVIRNVDQKGLMDLAKELAEISEKARSKQLTLHEMQGGSISISSLGGIGGTAFTPIINYPEVAILGVSKASYKPFYQDGEFVPRLFVPLSLSYDHRVIDGADGARFMVHLSNMLSDIRNLLL